MNIKFLNILNIATLSTLLYGAVPSRLIGQTYDQVLAQIVTFENQNPKKYTVSTTGSELNSIIIGMIQNDQGYLSEGLKRRLVAYAASPKILKQAAVAINPAEGDLLELLFYSRQGPVPVFITDVGLRGRVGKNGAAIKQSELGFWKSPNINKTNVIQALEGFPPATAAVLVDVISTAWYQTSSQAYQNIDTSWASQSLWEIYLEVREVELAKRSVVVKLLNDQGYITIPTVAYADFIYSGWPSIPIDLDPVTWSEADVPDLTRLLSNPYYAAAAQSELQALGY